MGAYARIDFDFAGRGPATFKGMSTSSVWTLGPKGLWEGLNQGTSDAFSALGSVPLSPNQVLIGWLAYEAGSLVEPVVPLRPEQSLLGEMAVFEASFGPQRVGRISSQAPPLVQGDWHPNQDAFQHQVAEAKEHIAKGDFFQVNLSMMSNRKMEGMPLGLYQALRAINPGPYNGLWVHGERAVVSNSPELLLKAEGGRLSSRPIAGTFLLEDGEPGLINLSRDPKERAEHIMLVDLIRNDLGRVAAFGSVAVTELLALARYSHVGHLESTVTADLAPDKTVWDALRAMFPGGTITGTPKVAAMQHIRQTESHVRGPYTGTLFVFEPPDRLTANILIRTAACEYDGHGHTTLQIGAGAGIVADSQPEKEWRECKAKLRQFDTLNP